MAKIRVKQGNNEIEIDSRDFYVDNNTAEEVIETLKQLINDKPGNNVINSLEDAEFHEPEFSQPVNVKIADIKNKLKILAKNSFGLAHLRALSLIERNPGTNLGELMYQLKITKQSLNRVLRGLLKSKMIKQIKDKEDTRKKNIFLETDGQVFFNKI